MYRTVVSAPPLRISIIIVGGRPADETNGRELSRLVMLYFRFSGCVYFKLHGHLMSDAFHDVLTSAQISVLPLFRPSTTQVLFDFLLSFRLPASDPLLFSRHIRYLCSRLFGCLFAPRRDCIVWVCGCVSFKFRCLFGFNGQKQVEINCPLSIRQTHHRKLADSTSIISLLG